MRHVRARHRDVAGKDWRTRSSRANGRREAKLGASLRGDEGGSLTALGGLAAGRSSCAAGVRQRERGGLVVHPPKQPRVRYPIGVLSREARKKEWRRVRKEWWKGEDEVGSTAVSAKKRETRTR